jgi:hypothetical protein
MVLFETDTAVVFNGMAASQRIAPERGARGIGISCIGPITKGDIASQTIRVTTAQVYRLRRLR